MQQAPFDELARMVATRGNRRSIARLLGLVAAPVVGLGAVLDADAGKKHKNQKKRKKKVTLCVNNVTTRVPKKKKQQFINQGATVGACPGGCTPVCNGCGGSDGCGGTCGCTGEATCFEGQCCTPTCTGCDIGNGCGGLCVCFGDQVCFEEECCTPTCTGCGGSDGCGSICGCDANQVCDGGVCHAFDLECNDTPAACGAALTGVLGTGGTIYLGPGTYQGNFSITMSTTLVGAGSSADPDVSTILDGASSGTVVSLDGLQETTLRALRITNGSRASELGGGIRADSNVELTVESCVITGNAATGSNSGGGGLAVISSSLTMRTSTVSNNTAEGSGGVFCNSGPSCEFIDSLITGNTATGDVGGGVNGFSSALIFTRTEISDNNAATDGGGVYLGSNATTATFDADSSVINNNANTVASAFKGGGIFNGNSGTLNLNGVSLTGNTPDQCFGTGCPV